MLRIAIRDPAIQQQRGVIAWQTGSRIGRMPVTFLADDRDDVVFAPVGINSDWTADVRNVRLVLPALPDWQALARLTEALLSAAVAASLPSGLFSERLSRAGLLAVAIGRTGKQASSWGHSAVCAADDAQSGQQKN